MILGENGDERAKGEYTRWKKEVGTLKTRSKLIQTCPSQITPKELSQYWPKRVHSREAKLFFSSNLLKQVITHLGEKSLNPSPTR